MSARRFRIDDHRYIELAQGDLTLEAVDAIVNAANSSLAPGGGVCGAIHRAGGPSIARDCQEIVGRQGQIPTGEAAATFAGNLPARFVIHAVGPVWNGGQSGEPESLASAYRAALREANQLGLESMSFPSISTGIYGYPVALAATVALRTVLEVLSEPATTVQRVRFVLFDSPTFEAYSLAMESLGAPIQEVES